MTARTDPMSGDDQQRLDVIAEWLRLEDPPPARVDLMLLFGGSTPETWETAAGAVTAGAVETLMLVGGRGHTTAALAGRLGLGADAVASEAEVMAGWLAREHGIVDVLLEPDSTDCGSNVLLAQDLARREGLRPRTVALVQDATMQRRMDAVFRHMWNLGEARPVNRPGPDSRVHWPRSQWVGLVLGEVPRLRDDEHGYGPRGRGFLAHVDVPPHVATAHAELLAAHPDWVRTVPGRRD